MEKLISLYNAFMVCANRFDARFHRSKPIFIRIVHLLVIFAMLVSALPLKNVLAAAVSDTRHALYQAGDEPSTPTPTTVVDVNDLITATLTVTPTISISPLITITPSVSAAPTITLTLTPTQVVETPTPTEPVTETPDPYPQPISSPTPIPYTATPTPEPVEPVLASESISLTLQSSGSVLPGTAAQLAWSVSGLPEKSENLMIVFKLPAGFTPPAQLAGSFDPAKSSLSLPLASAPQEIEWQVNADAQGPFELTAIMFDGDLELVRSSVVIQEQGLNFVPSTGGKAFGLGEKVRVIFPAGASADDLDVRVRPPIPSRVPPTSLSEHPFEILAQSRKSQDEIHKFDPPLTIEVKLDGFEPPATLFYYDPDQSEWVLMPTEYDPQERILRATSDHLSWFDTLPTEPDAARLPTLNNFNSGGFSGAANYSYPIWTPPGPAGLQPSLSLAYNSQNVDGATAAQTQASWVGMGWSLDTGFIERNMRSLSSPYTDKDTFSLFVNGVSSTIIKDTSGVYHFADENFWKVSFASDQWTVRDKEGTIYRFGSPTSHAEYKWVDPNLGVQTDTWHWPLIEIENKFGQKLTYSYTYEIQDFDGCGANTDYERAVYPDTIEYSNHHYRVKFILDAQLRTDFRSDSGSSWTSTTDCLSHMYQRKRLSAIEIQHTTTAGSWGSYSVVRRYNLTYTSLFSGYTWSGGGQTFSLASIQEVGSDGTSTLPASTFIYDGLHMTRANNGYGGSVIFSYDTTPWHDIANDPQYTREYHFNSHTDDCASWDGAQSSCSSGRLVVNGEANREIPVRAYQPGAFYFVHADITRKGTSTIPEAYIGLEYASGSYQRFYTSGINDGTSKSIEQYILLPATAQFLPSGFRTKMVINCQSCYVDSFMITRLPTRYRVLSQTIADTITSQSNQTSYQYDGAATNDAEHSSAVQQRTTVNDMWGLPYQEPRGQAMVREIAPVVDGAQKVTTTWYHQDDDFKGQAHTTMVGTQSFSDSFLTLDTTKWAFSSPNNYQVIERKSGDEAIKNWSPGETGFANNFYRNSYSLSNNESVLVNFHLYGDNATAALIVGEYDNYPNSNYRQWGLYQPASGDAKVRYVFGSTVFEYPLTNFSIANDVWYTLWLIFDNDQLFLRVWNMDDPDDYAQYVLPSPPSNSDTQTWRFRSWVNGAGGIYIDEYSEGFVYGYSSTSYGVCVGPINTGDCFLPGVHSTFSTYRDLKIRWTFPLSEKNLNFEGLGSTATGTARFYQYAMADQHNTQYGNQTRVVESYLENFNLYQDYRISVTEYYPYTSSTKNLVGLPEYTNQYKCPVAADNGACRSTYSSSGSNLLNSHIYIYDGHGVNFILQPSEGKLTQERSLLRFAGANYTDPRYNDAAYTYDSWGNVTSVTNYTGEGTTSAFASSGSRTQTSCYGAYTPGSGTSCTADTYHTYLGWGMNALGSNYITKYQYNYNFGQPRWMQDPNNAITEADYDVFGRQSKLARPGEILSSPTIQATYGNSTSLYWIIQQQLISSGTYIITARYYNGLGQLIQTQTRNAVLQDNACSTDSDTSPDTCDTILNTSYNALGQPKWQYVPYSLSPGSSYRTPDTSKSKTVTTYDLLGRSKVITNPDSSSSSFTYEVRQVKSTDARGYTTITKIDDLGRTVEVVPPINPKVTYTYDFRDQLTNVNYGGALSAFTYDFLGRKLTMTDPDMGSWTYTYDALNLTRQKDAKSQRICFYYDLLNRLTGKHYRSDDSCPSSPTMNVVYTYDTGTYGKGHRTYMSDPSGNTTWMYDNRGRMQTEVKTISGSSFTTSWTYNAADLPQTMTYPDNEVITYQYLPQGLLDKLYSNLKPDGTSGTYYLVQNTIYDVAGRILRRDLGATNTTNNPVLVNNNHYNLWTVDGGRMDYLKAGVYADQDSLLDLRYDYDAVGNLLSILDVPNSNQKQCFTYDANNRLLTARVGINDATCSGTVGNGEYPDETYSYSTTTGNLSSKTGLGTYTYDSTQPHAVDAVTGYTYLYDLNGNMTRRDPTGADYYDFLYDTENRLYQAKKNGAVLATFTYDGDGNRVKSVLGSTTTLFVGQHYETSGGVVTKYYAAGGARVAMRQGSTFYWLFSDHLGSTSKVANSSGALQSQQLYTAWGQTRYTSGTLPTRYTYTGQYTYATTSANDFGMIYYGARFYDNSLGRFVSPDSIIPTGQGVQGWDRFAFVNNNPVRYTDPSGHSACWDDNANQPGCKSSTPTGYGLIPSKSFPARENQPTLTDKIKQGDISALVELLIPSHIGGRLQLEASFTLLVGVSVSVGVNGVYNRYSDELAANVDWAIEGGGGIGAGASGTGGLLIGWGSSSVDDATKGFSGILSGTAAAEPAVSAAITAPLDKNGLHVDPYSGQVPFTGYFGVGGGGGYAGIGGGINGPTGIHDDLSPLLPWHWNK